MTRRISLAAAMAATLGVLFAVWTWLTLRTDALAGLDAVSLSPGTDPHSAWGQIVAAIAVVTTPAVVHLVMAGLAVWAWMRRLKNLAWAIAGAIPMSWLAIQGTKLLVRRPRPDVAAPLITAQGWAYPSGHVLAATALGTLVMTAIMVTHRPRAQRWAALALCLVTTGFIAYDRWALRAHWITDLVGGALLGGAVASLALAVAGVHVRVANLLGPADTTGRTCAIVLNPTKVTDWEVFRRHVTGAIRDRGWTPLWLETSVDDPGVAPTRAALKAGADLVMVAGGDGTVRTVCAEMAGSGVPLAILPAGTGNLLARNLNVPLDMADALDVAFDGRPQLVDIVRITADGGRPDHSVVMAGMGLDAVIMNETNDELKKLVGSAAYVMAGLQALGRPPFRVDVSMDAKPAQTALAGSVVIANVGALQGNLQVFPDARPDDGILDVVVASPKSAADWGIIAGRLMTGSAEDPRLARDRGRRVVIEAEQRVPYQIDGDTLGECRHLEAEVVPGAVTVMVG